MSELYIFLIIFGLFSTAFLLAKILKPFNSSRSFFALVFFPVLFFGIGYLMRLAGSKEAIDAGYFLTDLSFLISYLLIGVGALLGQVKYYKARI